MPADGVSRRVVQSDGKKLTIRQFGDEHIHFFMTSDSIMIVENNKGGFCYAIYLDNSLVPSHLLAHDPGERDSYEAHYVAERLKQGYDSDIQEAIKFNHRKLLEIVNKRRFQNSHKTLGEPTAYIGSQKGLVILVDFPNLQMISENPQLDYYLMFNQIGYSKNNHVGSVHDYFWDQSYGKLDLTFDVVGPLTVSKNYGYYGSDSMSGYNDMNVSEMITEACELADNYIDYNDYDWDSDGFVDQVYIIYAGYGQATGGASNTIWPHESYLYNQLELDNVYISQYACSNELYGTSGSENVFMGIGTACHEFSHCLGLPDLYDTDYSGAFGMSYWGVMNSGSYNGPKGIGEVPCGYTAFERWFAGWLDFIDIEKSQRIDSIRCIEQSPIAYKIKNEGNENEFYILENRQPDKWFKFVADFEGIHGLLITHIDYDFKAWTTNKVNPSPNHQRMSPIVADNSYGYSYEEFAGDLFPGIKNVIELTNVSHTKHGGRLFNENVDGSHNMNKSLINIQETDGLISLDVIFNNEIPTPNAIEPMDISENSFKAVWTSNGDVDYYTIELVIIKSAKPYLAETKLIDNVYQTECLIEDLDAIFCNYRVRANKNGLHTEWSNTIEVTLKTPTYLKDMRYNGENEDHIFDLNGVKKQLSSRHIYIKNKKKIFPIN